MKRMIMDTHIKALTALPLLALTLMLGGCKENYSEGEKVGSLIEFTRKGVIFDSWEGRLNMTQTGMNTSGEPFEFSFDNDRSDQGNLIELMKEAQVKGWKLKIRYHEVWGFKNIFWNRGETNYFVDGVTVLDKDFANPLKLIDARQGHVIDTVYVVVDKRELQHHVPQTPPHK